MWGGLYAQSVNLLYSCRHRVGSHFAHTKAVAPHSAACGGFFIGHSMALRANLIVEPILMNVPEAQGYLRWPEVFENDQPVQIEIGSGKGAFLVAAATQQPQCNFLGIEWARAYCNFAADRLRRRGLYNCRMVRAEALGWIQAHVATASVAAVHIYFPDPWPKLRHHKRRLIQPAFMQQVWRILEPLGKMRIVTDHPGYFSYMEETLAGCPSLRRVPFDSPLTGLDEMLVGTNFERKYAGENRPFYSLAVRKPS